MGTIWLLLLVALLGPVQYGHAQTSREELLGKIKNQGSGVDCTYVIQGPDDWKTNKDPMITAKVVCDGTTLHDETKAMSKLETVELPDQGATLFGKFRKLGRTFLTLDGAPKGDYSNCTFKNLPAFPKSDGGSPAPVVISGSKMDFIYALFFNNGGGYTLSGGVHITGDANLEFLHSIFEDCSGTNTGAMDIEDDSKVDIETSIFVRNVAEKIAGAIHVHLSGKVRIDKCAFVGAPVPKVFVSYAQGEIDELPKNVLIPNAGAISVHDDSSAIVDDSSFSKHGGIMGTIYTTHESTIWLDEVTLDQNVAGIGGGVSIEGDQGHQARLIDVNFTSNTARQGGGLVILGEGSVFLKGNFFDSNTALTGGGLFSDFAVPGTDEYESCGKATEGTRINIRTSSFLNNFAKYDGGGIHSKCTLVTIEEGMIRNNSAGGYGGGVFIEMGVELDVEITPFEGNKALKGGSCIYAKNTTSVDVDKSMFTGNSVLGNEAGGTLAAENSGKIVVTESTFLYNTVVGSGGALWLKNVKELEIHLSDLSGNEADESGGALWADGVSTSALLNQTTVDSNIASSMGGGVIIDNAVNVLLMTVTFINNTAVDDVGGLGLIGSGDLTASETIIEQNSAGGSCGGLHIGDFGDILLIDTSVSLNKATTNGGGICVKSVGNLTMDATVEVISNRAQGFGGGIHLNGASGSVVMNTVIENNLGAHAASLNVEDVNELIIKDMSFMNNVAKESCGALRLFETKKVEIENVIFINNEAEATVGGALCIIGVDELKLLGSTVFKKNVAKDIGGAIYVSNSGNLDFGSTNFEGNRADNSGGAIGGFTTEEFRAAGAVYEKNSCEVNGGSIDLDGVQNVVLDNVTFTSNRAGRNGGAVRLTEGKRLDILDTVLLLNEAGKDGGGVIARSFKEVELSGLTVKNNTAQGSGGGVFAGGAQNLRLLDTRIEYNRAKKSGGALEVMDSKVDGSGLILKENHADESGGAFLCQGDSSINMHKVNFTHNFAQAGQSLSTKCSCNVNVTDSFFLREKERKGNGDFFKREKKCSQIVHSGCMFFGAPDRGWPKWLIAVIALACTFGFLCCIMVLGCSIYRGRQKRAMKKIDEEAGYDELDKSPKQRKDDYSDDDYDDEYDGSEYDDVDLSDANTEDLESVDGDKNPNAARTSGTRPPGKTSAPTAKK